MLPDAPKLIDTAKPSVCENKCPRLQHPFAVVLDSGTGEPSAGGPATSGNHGAWGEAGGVAKELTL